MRLLYMLTLTAAIALVPLTASAENRTEAETVAVEFFAALEAKDMDRIADLFTPDIVNVLPFAAGEGTIAAPIVFDGLEQTMGYFGGAADRIATVVFSEIDLSLGANGTTVWAETQGDMILPDGRVYQNDYVWRFEIEDGSITRIHEYFDPIVANAAFRSNGG